MGESFNSENFGQFIKEFLAGSLTGKVKEEKAPSAGGEEEAEDDGSPSAVLTVTDANVKAEVLDSDRDILIEFYAPCKISVPTYI